MKRPCLHVPTVELKKAFLGMAHAQGYTWCANLTDSLALAEHTPLLVYATEYVIPKTINIMVIGSYADSMSKFVLVNSPRQFFDYLKARK